MAVAIDAIPWAQLPAAPPSGIPASPDQPSGPFASLPAELLQRVFSMLPHHEHLVHALMTCRSWHAVARDRMLWVSYAARLGLSEASEVWYDGHRLADRSARQWRNLAAERALHVACYQCGQPAQWRAAAGHYFQPILCAICADNFQLGRASHRMLSKTEAIFRYRLRAADLEDLPHAAVENPINANFTSMHLFRRPDVVRAAIKRWGGVTGMWKQMRKYRGAGLNAPPSSLLVRQDAENDTSRWIPATVVRKWATAEGERNTADKTSST